MYVFSKILILLSLFIIGRFIEALSMILLFSLVVIFQPELRKFLGYLVQPGFIRKTLFSPQKEETHTCDFVKELSDAIKYLSKSKIGALIVFQDSENLSDFSDIGTKIYSIISSELLLTIFHPNTALHDGAVIISPDKILAAGVLLPLTDNPELSWQYGTRHRAAIGITEIVTHTTCIVVSEETGFVSIVKQGVLTKIETLDILIAELHKLIDPKDNNSTKNNSIIDKEIIENPLIAEDKEN